MVFAEDKVDPTSGPKWRAQHPVGKGQDNIKIHDPHAQSAKDGGTADIDRIVKGDEKKEKDKTKETEKKPVEEKKETGTKPKPKDVDFVGDEITPPSIYTLTGTRPKGPTSGRFPHDPNKWQIGKYEEIGGRLWRDFRDKKISKEEYMRKMKMLRELKAQWEKWNDFYWKNILKTTDQDKQEMKDYRERIDKRMEEIYEWKPKSKPKEKKTKMDKPIALETGDATGIFQVADSFRGGSTDLGGAPPPDARSMTPMKTAHAPPGEHRHHAE